MKFGQTLLPISGSICSSSSTSLLDSLRLERCSSQPSLKKLQVVSSSIKKLTPLLVLRVLPVNRWEEP
jgi:hypothetical protein